jgi:hypothetical protein
VFEHGFANVVLVFGEIEIHGAWSLSGVGQAISSACRL